MDNVPFQCFKISHVIYKYNFFLQVSFIDSWLLCQSPIKWLLLQIMKKSKDDGTNDALKRQIVYSFGDHYYFRKELRILNLLTGCKIFLLLSTLGYFFL